MKKILEEFKAFALRGNVMDMAVGVIIGGAFNSLITSLVENVVMPALSLITGKIDFSNMFFALNGEHYATLEAAKEQTSVVAYGLFVTQLINFPVFNFADVCVVMGATMLIYYVLIEEPKKKKKAAAAVEEQGN